MHDYCMPRGSAHRGITSTVSYRAYQSLQPCTELATPTLELKPLKCCELVIFQPILFFVKSRSLIQKPGGAQVSKQHSL